MSSGIELALAGMPDLRARRPSAVSQILRALGDPDAVRIAPGKASRFRMRLANDRASREEAFRLAQRVYADCGYVASPGEWCVAKHDFLAHTLVILAEDPTGRTVATATLVPDSPFGLPCDEVFGAEADGLRQTGRQLSEVTRLAIAPQHRGSRALLIDLFVYLYAYARHVAGAQDFVIEVNPRHAAYYRKLLCFDVLGIERPCPRVNGAPAVLLRLDFDAAELAAGHRQPKPGEAVRNRSMLPCFPSPEEIRGLARRIERDHRAMSAAEARAFRKLPSTPARAAGA